MPNAVAGRGRKDYLSPKMPRLLTFFAVALAMAFSPIVMMTGVGMAAAHASTMSTMEMSSSAEMDSHCADPAGDQNGKKADMKPGCVSTCSAISPAALRVAEPCFYREPVAAIPHRSFDGIFPDQETPPPRMTQEV